MTTPHLREMANSAGSQKMTAIGVDELAALRAKVERFCTAFRDVLCVTQENYHTGCTCLSCTAYVIARDALEKK